jgi:hypothetical protein
MIKNIFNAGNKYRQTAFLVVTYYIFLNLQVGSLCRRGSPISRMVWWSGLRTIDPHVVGSTFKSFALLAWQMSDFDRPRKLFQVFVFLKTFSFRLKTRVARWYIFQTKIPYLGKFWRVLQWNMMVYFMAIRPILRPLCIFCGHLVYLLVIWYICW